MAVGYAPRLPLEKNFEDGCYGLLKNIRSLTQQNLKMLILTAPGERMMDPNYGVGLRRYLFEQDTPELPEKLKGAILRQVSQYMPHLRIEGIGILTPATQRNIPGNSMQLRIEYAIPAIKEIAFLELDMTPRNMP